VIKMDGETLLKIIKALNTAKVVLPVALAVGFIMLVATGVIEPTGDPIDKDAGIF